MKMNKNTKILIALVSLLVLLISPFAAQAIYIDQHTVKSDQFDYFHIMTKPKDPTQYNIFYKVQQYEQYDDRIVLTINGDRLAYKTTDYTFDITRRDGAYACTYVYFYSNNSQVELCG